MGCLASFCTCIAPPWVGSLTDVTPVPLAYRLVVRRARGQAQVELALTLPLVVFLLLGVLQLFLAFQARALADYAAFRAVRVGSTNHADCRRMMDASVLALLPAFDSYASRSADPSDALADSFRRHGALNGYRYDDAYAVGSARTSRFVGDIVWLTKRFSRPVDPLRELEFDQPGPPQRLSVELIFWYPLKVPFANMVVSLMVAGSTSINPLMPTSARATGPLSLNGLLPALQARRSAGELVLPIAATATMRMMSPVLDAAPSCGGP